MSDHTHRGTTLKRVLLILLVVFVLVVAGMAWLLHWSMHAVKPSTIAVADSVSLRNIGLACRMYAEEHQGQYPPDWSCFDHNPRIYKTADEWDKAGAMSNVMAWTSFGYVPGVTTASPPDTVVAYLRPRQYGRTLSGLILFADGNVVSVNPEEFQRIMSQPTTNRATVVRPGTRPIGKGYD
jgi:hypothetical protein